MAINLTKNGKTTVTTLELNCTEFIDWFLQEIDPDYERFAPGLNFMRFTGCSERISTVTNLENLCDSSVYTCFVFGIICEQYDRGADWVITEYKGSGRHRRISYSYEYKVCVKYSDGTRFEFTFRTVNRNSVFNDHEQLEKNKIAEELKHLNDCTVLCLEDKSILFSKACELIHEAIERGYYCGYDKDIDLDQFDNNDEIILEWMNYKTACSHECLYNQIVENPTGNLVGQAADEALNWFINGFKNNLLYRLY